MICPASMQYSTPLHKQQGTSQSSQSQAISKCNRSLIVQLIPTNESMLLSDASMIKQADLEKASGDDICLEVLHLGTHVFKYDQTVGFIHEHL